MPIVARFLSTADFIANHTPAEPSAPIGKITFRRERDRQLAIKKKVPAQSWDRTATVGGMGRRLSRSKQIRRISSVRIAL